MGGPGGGNYDREVIERFAAELAPGLSVNPGAEVAFLLLQPWTGAAGRDKPEEVFVLNGVGGALSEDELAEIARTYCSVLVPVTFEDPAEEGSANRMLPLLTAIEGVSVFLVQLLPKGTPEGREGNEITMQRYDAMLNTGVDDVFMDPSMDLPELQKTISLARVASELNVRRMHMMLDAEPAPVSDEAVRALQTHHRKLLWETIPRALMPHFARLDRNLVETGKMIGPYQLLRKFPTMIGTVLQAVGTQNEPLAIKVFDKAQLVTPGELECLYREFRFLSHMIKHPNIVRCLNMLQSPARVYLVFELVGNHNLQQFVSALPGQRLDPEEALRCFRQVGSGLAYCHARDVAHRNVALQHVVLEQKPDTEVVRLWYRVIDFNCAMMAKGQTLSRTFLGYLPCVAPEVALGRPYVPHVADCWSVGILLLEVAGGIFSLSSAVPYDPEQAEPAKAADLIRQFFTQRGSHARALATLGAVSNQEINEALEALLKPEPQERAPLRDLLPSGGEGPTEAPAASP